MQDSLVHCRYATSLPCPLNASRVPQSLRLPSPQCPKCPLGDSAIPFENHCSSCCLWKFLSSDICRAGSLSFQAQLKCYLLSEGSPDHPVYTAPIHSATSPHFSSLYSIYPYLLFFFSWFIVCVQLPECKIHEGRDVVSCSQLCPLCLEQWLAHS